MDRAKTYYRYFGGVLLNILVSRRLFCTEVFPRGRMEQKGMRILVKVRTNFAENRKRS